MTVLTWRSRGPGSADGTAGRLARGARHRGCAFSADKMAGSLARLSAHLQRIGLAAATEQACPLVLSCDTLVLLGSMQRSVRRRHGSRPRRSGNPRQIAAQV